MNAARYAICAIQAGLFIWAAGCESTSSEARPAEEISALKQEKVELQEQVKQYEAKNEQLKEQVQVMSGLKPEVRLENLYDLRKVKISRYTNLYDKDNDGRKETLIVYLQPIDQEDDIIKASGAVEVELWDLNKDEAKAILGRWQVQPDELKKMWFATLITINYRLAFDAGDIIDKFKEPLTVKVTFTDYLSGKVLKEQKIIRP